MRRHKSAFAFLSGILLLVASPLCAQTLTATPTTPHPTQPLYISATGFADAEAVDVYIDTTDTELLVSSSTGTFTASVTLPAGIQPGIHYITAVGRRSGDAAQSAVTVTTSWLQVGFGATKRGWNPYENTLNDSNANTLGAAWSAAANGSGATPVINAGSIYVTTAAGVSRYATATGSLVWNKISGENFYGAPALSGSTLYAGGASGTLYALKASSGATTWSVSLGSVIYSSPVVVNGVVFVGTNSGVVYAVNASTGATLWTYATGAYIDGSAAVENGVVYIGSNDKNLYALNASTGALLWSFTTGGPVESTPSVVNGLVYFGSDDGKVYAVSTVPSPIAPYTAGSLVWSYNTGGAVFESPAFAYNKVYVGGTAGSLLALDGRTGAVAWSFATDSYPRPPAVANGLVYFTSNNGAIYALDANSGAVEWHGRSGGTFFGGPAVSDGVLYVNTYESQLVAYAPNADTNSVISHVSRPSPASLRPNMALKVARWQ